MDTHEIFPNVVQLQIHLPGQHLVVFNPLEDLETVRARGAAEETSLTAFFKANRDNGPLGMFAVIACWLFC